MVLLSRDVISEVTAGTGDCVWNTELQCFLKTSVYFVTQVCL